MSPNHFFYPQMTILIAEFIYKVKETHLFESIILKRDRSDRLETFILLYLFIRFFCCLLCIMFYICCTVCKYVLCVIGSIGTGHRKKNGWVNVCVFLFFGTTHITHIYTLTHVDISLLRHITNKTHFFFLLFFFSLLLPFF
ncbi:hypothetical protein BDA99DRAFT_520055 [Phascolomyces articulosus]|uniref:Uncharacterized protein n=1 Tax=Phascolomyces articulosus TaxID=60185 RepID=A0AAD5K3N4_9FUNG|nr:hypothetical protein BDA99DRAFT_520055 [Phascolomyces articulosus]